MTEFGDTFDEFIDESIPDDDRGSSAGEFFESTERLVSRLYEKGKQIPWPIVICYSLLTLLRFALFIIFTSLLDEGLGVVYDNFSMPLCKYSLASFLSWFEITSHIKAATPIAILIYLGVSSSLKDAIRHWAIGEGPELLEGLPELSVRRNVFLYGRASVVFLVDQWLTYNAVRVTTWGDSVVDPTAVGVCVVYAAVLLFAASKVVQLEDKIRRLRVKND